MHVLAINAEDLSSDIVEYDMLSYMFARMYILYFREDANYYRIFQDITSYLEVATQDELSDEALIT